MSRFTSVFLSILLGAFSVGVAVTPFYVLANRDRHTLASDLESATARAEQAEREKRKLAEEASARVEDANAEVEKAQEVISLLKEEQDLAATAQKLDRPSSRELTAWKAVVSIPQHASAFIPKTSATELDTGDVLRIVTPPADEDPYTRGEPWLEIFPYDALKEKELLAKFASSTRVAFLANDRLLAGVQGTLASDEPAYLLVYRANGERLRLIFLRDLPVLGRHGAERVLATMTFE